MNPHQRVIAHTDGRHAQRRCSGFRPPNETEHASERSVRQARG
jgi:hypothetical protein